MNILAPPANLEQNAAQPAHNPAKIIIESWSKLTLDQWQPSLSGENNMVKKICGGMRHVAVVRYADSSSYQSVPSTRQARAGLNAVVRYADNASESRRGSPDLRFKAFVQRFKAFVQKFKAFVQRFKHSFHRAVVWSSARHDHVREPPDRSRVRPRL